MMERCRNPKADRYFHYGGRGIKVCDSWHDFAKFLADMGERPSPKHSIERRDNNSGYSPDNCYWATLGEQARNKRTNVMLTFNGETKCRRDWVIQLGIKESTLRDRLKAGWSVEEAFASDTANSNTL